MGRLFIALWPRGPAIGALENLAGELAVAAGAKPAPAAKIHLPLVFLGELDGERLALAAQVAAGQRSDPFELALDRVGSFRSARVAWAGVSQPPAALLTLQAKLAAALRAAAFELEERAFVAHLTL